jgi:hypothetical protein
MQTMDAALVDLVRRGKITQQVAERRSSTPDELKRLMGQSGVGPGGLGNGAPGTPAGNGAKVG